MKMHAHLVKTKRKNSYIFSLKRLKKVSDC